MNNILDKFSTLSHDALQKSADDAAMHRFELENLDMQMLNNPHKFTEQEQTELQETLELVVSLENEIHAEIQWREGRRQRQWL